MLKYFQQVLIFMQSFQYTSSLNIAPIVFSLYIFNKTCLPGAPPPEGAQLRRTYLYTDMYICTNKTVYTCTCTVIIIIIIMVLLYQQHATITKPWHIQITCTGNDYCNSCSVTNYFWKISAVNSYQFYWKIWFNIQWNLVYPDRFSILGYQ